MLRDRSVHKGHLESLDQPGLEQLDPLVPRALLVLPVQLDKLARGKVPKDRPVSPGRKEQPVLLVLPVPLVRPALRAHRV